jgi:nucleoside-diphosphate-sugar epimerase
MRQGNTQLSGFTAPLIENEEDLDRMLSTPTPGLVEALSEWEGDLLILGAGGKIGPRLAAMARTALAESGKTARVIAVDLFPAPAAREALEADGIEAITCDLLDREALARLPDAPNVIFMAGRKFGSTGDEPLTWALNVHVPALVADRYRDARIVVFSSGNVYPFTPVTSGGPTEDDPVGPVGEYAQSCLGRERMFQHFSRRFGTRATILRLNYAIDLRYGVILDVAQKVHEGLPIDVTMGYVNVVWQGDVNARTLRSFSLCQSPPTIVNITGPEAVSVRAMAERLGELMGRQPVFEGREADTALLSNASRARALFGEPTAPLDTMVQWVAHWVMIGGPTLDKPTHFEQRDGKF